MKSELIASLSKNMASKLDDDESSTKLNTAEN